MSQSKLIELLYISGEWPGEQAEPTKNKFSIAKEKLTEMGYSVITPDSLFKDMDTSGFSQNDYLRKRTAAMAQCDKVITLPDCYDNFCSKTEVAIARLLLIEVESIIKYVPPAELT